MNRAVIVAVMTTGCRLGPQISDERGASGDIVPAGTAIPPIDEDAEDALKIAMNDGVDGTVPRLSGFAAGANIGNGETHVRRAALYLRRMPDGSLEEVECTRRSRNDPGGKLLAVLAVFALVAVMPIRAS